MTSLSALRSHIPQQFDKFDKLDKFTKRPSQAPPQQQQQQVPPPNQGAAADYYASSEEACSQYPSPCAIKTLELAPRGHSMVVTTGTGDALVTITFASNSSDEKAPDLIVLRGNGAGDEIASAQFHRWTTSKTEVYYNGKKIKIKKDFESSTGLGKARWEKDGRKAMKLRVGKEVVARFEAVGKGKRKKGTGQFDIMREGMTRNQLEEIVISCLVERERMRRDGELGGEILQEGAWELFMASLGIPLP
ncbi:hypothetical protein F5Y15DRAFT_112738 [Xylariaceae sp. FL0016]|nr:hypothetical protein F5Y15DRAFT_112738 [Xylariaceae sp. FL0016]